MTEHWTERLSEYVDGTLPVEERRQVDAHLPECDACALVVRELRAVAERASTFTGGGAPASRRASPGV
jgi:anti-sigma factor RsiW